MTKTSGQCFNAPESEELSCTTEVRYFGHLITKDRIKPDPAKIAGVQDMQPPKDKGKLESILSMVN